MTTANEKDAPPRVPCVNGTQHREVPTFRWELPKAECGVILHPYTTVDPERADLTLRCETCFPPLLPYPNGHTHPTFVGCHEATPRCPKRED